MNSNQRIHLDYGLKMLEGKLEASRNYYLRGGHEDKEFGKWLIDTGLDIDPLTRKKASRPVRAACLWAAEDPHRFENYAKKYPRSLTARSLHDRYRAEQNGVNTDPSVYIYRMLGPLSGEVLEPQICKIGYADEGAAARVNAQSRKAAVGYIPKIEMELRCHNPIRLENLIHRKFKDRQVKVPGREWFMVSLDEVEEALQEMERNGLLWRDGDWIYMGRRPAQTVLEN